ncbi:hypothetical protein GCM10008938_44290 [Deinococcus roseus]|uniref:Intein C-terminal splicing domain-containing protein n=2 Tax=Deinococcus roseus TaxID=392414 RepID=A0ABQ2DDT9_9DEIO|nr:hypothetical protein GCM10008938_44290 [Deinococcus roseus]
MYNLEVQEAHTFFVGTQGWLVHNCPDADDIDQVQNLFNLSPDAKLFRGEKSMQDLFKRLEKYNGIPPELASKRLHAIKQKSGLGGADNVTVDATGNVFDSKSGELLGSLTQGGAKGK